MIEFSRMGRLDVWYERVDIDRIAAASPEFATAFAPILKKAERKTSQGALPKLTEIVDGRRKIVDEPPLIVHGREITDPFVLGAIRHYRESLDPDRRILFDHYQLVDIARKVVGVGSVGLRAVRPPVRGPRWCRPAVPPDEGGDPLGARTVRAGVRVRAPG